MGISANELRIGNWFLSAHGNLPFQWMASDFENIDTTQAKPIALTPEILEKAGFKEEISYDEDERKIYSIQVANNTSLYYDKNLNNKNWYLSHFDNNNHYQNDFWATPEHLHQLQNLYFALTGEELEIKL